MEGLEMQTTEADETTLDFGNTEETKSDLKGATKKDRKDLFQINTHPATVLAANNKRDRRLKQIVMRVVAFCKKEHEEGLQVPFRFFKKRASLMTGVSLSTIHRIETIDMQLGDPDPAKVKKEGAAKDKPKKKKKKKKKENVEVDSGGGGGGGGNVHAAHVTGSVHPPAVSVHTHVPCAVHANLHANGVQTANVAAVSATANGAAQLFQYSDLANMASQIHFQTLPAVSLPQQLPIAPHPVTVPTGPDVGVKQEKRRRKKAKLEETVAALSQISTNGNTNKVINNSSSIQQSTANIITKSLTNIQPAALHSLAGVTGGTVTTINVHNAAATLPTTDRTTAPCTWTTGPLGPFTMGDLRDTAGHQLQVGTSHVQVGAQSVPVGTAIPVNAQLQPLSVSTAMGTPQTFTGHIDTSNWPPGTVGPFGTLQGTATLVGQQVLQAYQNNINSNHPVSIVHHQQQQQQQQQQQTQTP